MNSFFYADCEDMNLVWESEQDLLEFDRMWNEGADIKELTKRFKKTQNEIAIHVIDRHHKGYLRKRKNGVWGD